MILGGCGCAPWQPLLNRLQLKHTSTERSCFTLFNHCADEESINAIALGLVVQNFVWVHDSIHDALIGCILIGTGLKKYSYPVIGQDNDI